MEIGLTWPAAGGRAQRVRLKPGAAGRSVPGVGWIGAGAFSTGTLLPAFRDAGFERFVAVATASGVAARRAAGGHGVEKAGTRAHAVDRQPECHGGAGGSPHPFQPETTIPALCPRLGEWGE